MAILLFVTLCGLIYVSGLQLENALEGPCSGIRYEPLPTIDLDFVDSLIYVPGGNRYHFYRHARGHPHFNEMSEDQLYNNLCINRTASHTEERMDVFGFGGRLLGRFNLRPRKDKPTIYDVTPFGSKKRTVHVTTHLSLTDYKTFAFIANCWDIPGEPNQRSWLAMSLTPELTPDVKRYIQEHAMSLGFSREEMVFLTYKSCEDPFA